MDSSSVNFEVQGEVLNLTVGDRTWKVKLPRGDKGPPGRDGISVRGEEGPQGPPGRDGLAGRDSLVPGPQGPQGDRGHQGLCPQLLIGSIVTGDLGAPPSAVMSGTIERPVINLVLPRGERGPPGTRGLDGKDGRSDRHEIVYAGTSPRFTTEFLNAYVIADGTLTMPDARDVDMGVWCYLKTFSLLMVDGLVEPPQQLDKEGSRFVVIHYGDGYKWTRMG